MDLNLVRITIGLSEDDLHCSRHVSGGRSICFEDSLYRLNCRRSDRQCCKCRLLEECPLPALTGRLLSPDPEIIRRHQRPGLPFIFSSANLDDNGGQSLTLTLLGSAVHQLSILLDAFIHCSETSNNITVSALNYQNQPSMLSWSNGVITGELPVLSAAELVELYVPFFYSCSGIRLKTFTPVRIVHDKRELSKFEPVIFVKSVLRRVSSLAAYYGVAADQQLLQNLFHEASSVFTISSDRNVQQATTSAKRGIYGDWVIGGISEGLGSMLMLGSLLNTGKGASFGMGAFQAIPVQTSIS